MNSREAFAFIIAYKIAKQRKMGKKECWMRKWVSRRNEFGACSTLVEELRLEDAQQFRNFIRMSAVQFELLLDLVKHHIVRQDTKFRDAISVHDRLMVTLRFLASGESYSTLQYLFRIPPCTIGRIVPEVCKAIYDNLKEEYLKAPSTPEKLKEYADQFASKWQFPHCFGAIDGKHITMVAPADCGSLYYNYKNTHSIVLMAVADANYKFIYIDVGCNGRISDGGVFSNCSLHHALESKQLPVPEPEPLPERQLPVPYVMVADDAFAMTSYILKPYGFRNQPAPNRIFNYRLSRARRIVENAFGIMSSKFRVLRNQMNLAPDKVRKITLSTCILHNFLMSTSPHYLCRGSVDYEDQSTHETAQGEWRNEPSPEGAFLPLQRGHQRNYSVSQKDVRDEFKEYFMTNAGEVYWQYRFILNNNNISTQ